MNGRAPFYLSEPSATTGFEKLNLFGVTCASKLNCYCMSRDWAIGGGKETERELEESLHEETHTWKNNCGKERLHCESCDDFLNSPQVQVPNKPIIIL
jgi:hypothetical protein